MKSWFNRVFGGKNTKEQNRQVARNNSICMIEAYRTGSTWAFDDPRVGLFREPFVYGIEVIIDDIFHKQTGKKAKRGDTIDILFSGNPFPDASFVLEWESAADGGNFYILQETKQRGWLCPALYQYFSVAPERIYIKM